MYTKDDLKKSNKKGKPNASSTQSNAMANARFINIALTKEQSAFLKAKQFTSDDAFAHLERLLDDGYKLSVSYDDYHNCFSASLVPIGVDHMHAGFILAGKGSSALKAVKQLMYIHYELLDGIWPTDTVRPKLELDD